MMQDATDYLGERQRGEYQRWKKGIMARVEEIEAAE
jgi:origin recognition complex subunit 6